MKSNYETIMVISTKLDEEATKAMIEKFKSLIEKHGVVGEVEEWGKRRLAYEIQKETEGYYVLINFESEPDFLKELDRIYNITDGLLRSLTVRKEQ